MTQEQLGRELHSDDALIRREAARAMGSAKTERKAMAARENGAKRRGQSFSEEHRAKLREAQAARREREHAERIALGLAAPAPEGGEKKRPGRPRKVQIEATAEAASTPKRPVGRPKKQSGQLAADALREAP